MNTISIPFAVPRFVMESVSHMNIAVPVVSVTTASS